MEEKHYTRNDIHILATRGYLDARRNERSKETQLAFEIRQEEFITELANSLYHREWTPLPPIVFIKEDPVLREIFAPQFVDRIVSHILFDLVAPIFERTFIYDSYSCRVGKGTLFGIERFEHHIRSATDNYRYEAFILNLDISGYFMNIDKAILYRLIWQTLDRYRYKDCGKGKKWGEVIGFDFVDYLIRSILMRNPLNGSIFVGNQALKKKVPPQKLLENSPEGVGLIIGDLNSQLDSNIYLNAFDHFVKRVLHISGYGRYVDDARLIDRNYGYLLECKDAASEFLRDNLRLTVHPAKTTITSTRETNFFLGAAVEDYRRYAKTETLARFRKTVKGIEEAMLTGQMIDIEGTLSNMNSYLGYLSHFKTQKYILKTLKNSPLLDVYSLTNNCHKLKIKKQYETDHIITAA